MAFAASRSTVPEVSQLGAERGETCSSDLRHSFVVEIGNNPEQFFDALAANWRDDPKLGKMGTDRIDHCRLLANEQVTGAMEHQAALLLGCLGRHEPHVCLGDRLADGLSVGGIVLVSLDVGLHVGRRHQARRMTKSLQFARPMMRRRTCFDANEARR
jgi:hypothetical protein